MRGKYDWRVSRNQGRRINYRNDAEHQKWKKGNSNIGGKVI